MNKKVLVIDIGGSNVKLMISRTEKRKFPSGPDLTPGQMLTEMKPLLRDSTYDVVSMGVPAPVQKGRILSEPKNLGAGWTRFDFEKALGKPIRLINDAALQALGSFHGGRMLFLGLGTGLGSTLIWETNVLPLELGDLPFGNHETIEDYLGKAGMKRLGDKEWKREVLHSVAQLKKSFIAEYVVLGGSGVKKFRELPQGIEMGQNRNVFLGGVRLWQANPRTRRPKWNIM